MIGKDVAPHQYHNWSNKEEQREIQKAQYSVPRVVEPKKNVA
jgi:hypothetical protein